MAWKNGGDGYTSDVDGIMRSELESKEGLDKLLHAMGDSRENLRESRDLAIDRVNLTLGWWNDTLKSSTLDGLRRFWVAASSSDVKTMPSLLIGGVFGHKMGMSWSKVVQISRSCFSAADDGLTTSGISHDGPRSQ